MLADFILSYQETAEEENPEISSMVKMSLCCTSEEREEKRCLEAKLATMKGQATSAQESADKLTTSMAVLEKSLGQL